MAENSVSAMEMKGSVSNRGSLDGKLYKHLSPVTLQKIKLAVPFVGRINLYERSFAYILTSVVTGEEKVRKQFKRGEIAFMPAGCMLCFFLQDTKSYKPMNPLGELVQGLDVLETSRRGDFIQIDSISPLGS
ncbi:MAG: hypothetical protein JRN20_12545 [Nitrososphaerota archaeon]|nr:hypothetical protein [Nitrososphaerota archaeon]